ncbi:MAG: mannose-1-phosphate guanylyltransferase/mannose-6-phosphate isomerase, partial [Pseudomonadota bacterium]
MLHPVILCGGSGTRLWPASRKAYPKQFAPLLGPESLFQSTLRRLSGPTYARPLVMTNVLFRFLAAEQAAELGLTDARTVIEPSLRNTAPAILAAAFMVAAEDSEDALMLVSPSDHVIDDVAAFNAAVEKAARAAQEGNLVTFGVAPDRPETGYGYLELSAAPDGSGASVPLTSFREKPDADTAARFVASGRHLWNAGIFLFRVRDLIAAFEEHAPDIVDPVKSAVANGRDDLSLFRLDETAYGQAPAISIDFAIMERASRVAAVPMPCRWSDLGAWDAILAEEGPDADGNATHGAVTLLDSAGSYVRSEEPGMQVVGLGLTDMVVVAMRDAVLVADRNKAQDVRHVVDTLRDAQVSQADDYPRFHRPWGWYETLCIDDRFQVKRIMVRPGGVLSLQSHMHRSEHWVVVAGTAEVTIGD